MPHKLSFSQKSTLSSCSWKWMLTKRMRKHGPPSWSQIGGSAVHLMSERIDKVNLGIDVSDYPADFEGAMDRCETEALDYHPGEFTRADIKTFGRKSARWPEKENREWWLENGPSMLTAWENWVRLAGLDVYVSPDLKTVGVELEFEVETNDAPPVVGRIDRLMRQRSDGRLVIVDLKTGSHQPETAEQLGVYKVGLEQEFGLTATAGLFWFGRTGGSSMMYDLSEYTEARLNHEYAVAEAIIDNNLFMPSVDRHCSYCDVAQWCQAVGGEKAHEIPLPYPAVRDATITDETREAS